MRLGLRPLLLTAVERDQIDVCRHQVRVDRGGSFVRRDRAADVALFLQGQPALHVRAGVLAKRPHTSDGRILDRGPGRAELLRACQRLPGLVDAPQATQHHAFGVPRGAELGKQPHGRLELGAAPPPFRPSRRGCGPRRSMRAERWPRWSIDEYSRIAAATSPDSNKASASASRAGAESGARRTGAGQQACCGGMMGQARFDKATKVEPVVPALEGPRPLVHGGSRLVLPPRVEHHREVPEPRGIVRMRLAPRSAPARWAGATRAGSSPPQSG